MSSGTLSEQEQRLREDLARQREAVQTRQSQISSDERENQRRLHWMRCPKCGGAEAAARRRVFHWVSNKNCYRLRFSHSR